MTPFHPNAFSAPQAGVVHLWRVSLAVSDEVRAHSVACLDADERARMERFRFDRHQRRFAARRAALRQILAEYIDVTAADVAFRYSEHGKPELASGGDSSLRFNLSDSGDLAVVAVTSQANVGVDVEVIRPLKDMGAVARRAFSVRECEALFSLPSVDQLPAFYACWTRKEAWLKARGEGIIGNLGGFSVSLGPGYEPALLDVEDDPEAPGQWTLQAWTPDEGVAGAVALEATQLEVRHRVFEWPTAS